MKKILTWLLVFALVAALGVVPALAADEQEVWGLYTLVDMVGSDIEEQTGMDAQTAIAMMASLGMNATLEIREDGSAVIDLFGQKEEMTFDFEKGTVKTDNVEFPYVLEDGVLSFSDEEQGLKMSFSKEGIESLKGVGAFEYYTLLKMTDEEGKTVENDPNVSLTIFPAGDAVMNVYGEETELFFNFDEKTFYLEDDEEELVPYTLEDGILTVEEESGASAVFQIADPGWIGSYVATELYTEEEGDLTAALAMLTPLNMAPTLVIEEDGKGVFDYLEDKMTLVFDFDTMTLVAEEEPENVVSFTYENGTLHFETDGSSITFGRCLPAEESVSAGAAVG